MEYFLGGIMDNELQNISEELRKIDNSTEEWKRGGGSLGRIMKYLVPAIIIIIAVVIIFFPWKKIEYTILNKKTILCYNPISKICVSMELEKQIETRYNKEVEYYEVVSKGSGYVSISYDKNNDESRKMFYIDYGYSYISFDEYVIEEYQTYEISSFNVIVNYLFGNIGDEFLQKNVE